MKQFKLSLFLLLVASLLLLVGCKAKFTVSFESNCNDIIAPIEVTEGEPATKPADPVKEGYNFVGWYLGDVEYKFTEPVLENITLSAKWEEKEYTVTFVTDSDTKIDAQKVKYNKTASKPADPVKEGYIFKGWYNGDAAYSFSEKVTSDLTIKAKWEEIKKFTVKFIVEGEVLETQTIEDGKDAKAPTAPTLEGKTFVKWEGTYTNVTADVEIVAVYEVTKYTVTFKADGYTVKSVEVEHGKAAEAPADPTKDGYKFVGWDKEFNEVKSNLEVNAKFELVEYAIKYFNGDKEIANLEPNKFTIEDTITLANYDVDGYYFFGWYNNSGLAGDAITEIVKGTTGDVSLYALNVKADINGGSDCWTTEIPAGYDVGKGIDEISNLPEMFEMDFFKYLKDNNLLTDSRINSTMVADTWAKFSGINPMHNGDPKRIWNDTSSNVSGGADGYVSVFLYDSIIMNDDYTVDSVTGGFLGTEPYKTKYRGVLNHLVALYQYKVENNSYTELSAGTNSSKALLGFVIDGYFYGTQGAAKSYFTALRSVIPGMSFSYKISGDTCEKITYEGKALPTPVKDGYVFAGWCLDKEGTKPLATNKPTNLCTIYAKWEVIQ